MIPKKPPEERQLKGLEYVITKQSRAQMVEKLDQDLCLDLLDMYKRGESSVSIYNRLQWEQNMRETQLWLYDAAVAYHCSDILFWP